MSLTREEETKRRSRTGGKERQEAGRPQPGGVDRSNSRDYGVDREGSRGISDSLLMKRTPK